MADQGSIANLKQNINENIYDNTEYDISGGRMNTVLQNIVDTLEFNGRDFFNVNEYREKSDEYADAAAARAAVPDEVKKIGLVITYLLADGWYIDQFIGSNISGWATTSNWAEIYPNNQSTLKDINKRIGIFPFGIDKGLTKNGSLANNTHFTVTPFIPVSEGETIQCRGYSGGYDYNYSLLCTYDSNKDFVAAYGNDNGNGLRSLELTIPSGVAYIRVGSRDDATSNADYYGDSFVNCHIVSKLMEAIINNQNAIASILLGVTSMQEDISDIQSRIVYKQLYNDAINGKIINTANGDTTDIGSSYPNQVYTDYIPVKPNQTIWVSGWFGLQVGGAGYDANKQYVSRLFDTSDSSAVYRVPEYSERQRIIIPEGVYFIRSCSKDNVSYPMEVLLGEYLQEAIDGIKETINRNNSPIRIHKIDSTHFYVAIYNSISQKEVLHYFIHQDYSKTLNYGSGLTKTIKCGDIWYPNRIVYEGKGIIQGNLNFIYLISSTLTSDSSSPFYKENSHVGAGHGGEIMEFQNFFADGKLLDLSAMNSDNDLYCEEFVVRCKANNYAIDTSQPGFASEEATLKLDNNGEPILTAIHTYIATYKRNNNIIWDNNLLIKRNGLIFDQCHGGMCQGQYPEFNNVVVMNNNYDNNDYIISGGATVCTPLYNSVNLYDNPFQTTQEVMLKGNIGFITQKMTQEGDRYNNNYAKLVFFTSSGDERLKIYMEPVKTTEQFPNDAETFNNEDIIKVHVERNIGINY